MVFWLVMGLMCLAAVVFTVLPLFRDSAGQRLVGVVTIVFVVAVSAGVYANLGQPGQQSGPIEGRVPDVSEMVASLAERLERDSDDVEGWKMLGRSYMTLKNYPEAVKAYERAVELESAQNAQTLVGLGEAMLASSGQSMDFRIASIFDNALALEPNNPAALFWGGIGAVNRGDPELAATRWETLLGTNPPPEIRDILHQRIAEWRGEPVPEQTVPPTKPIETPGVIVSASIAVSPTASEALPDDATVFVIARDPAQPAPPIAVTRRRLSELPAVIELGDRDSMIPGRSLSGFAEFELVARVSLSGQPAAAPGDWFGRTIVRPAEGDAVELSIDSRVP